jgi:hypothetical protein
MPNESRTDGAPESASPFPPAFRWETSTQEAPTQVMGEVGRDTALFEPATQHPAEQHPADLSQPVGTPLNRLSDSSSPPWASLEPPPIAEQQSDWLRMGPEEFQSSAPQSRSKYVIGIAVLAVVVLGLVGAAVMHSLAGGSPKPNRTGNVRVTAPPTTAPQVQPVQPEPPSVPADAPSMTVVAPVTPPSALPADPEASGNPESPNPESPPIAPAAPPPAGLAPNPPLHRSTGGSSQGHATAPAPHTASNPPPAASPPPPPAPASAPDGWTVVPAKPWNPQAPQ